MKKRKIIKKIKNYFKKHKKWFFYSLGGIFILGIITSVVLIINKKEYLVENQEINQSTDNFYKLSEKDVFPEINSRDYYDLIEIKNNKAVISEKMISFFISDVIKKLGVSYGDIKFNYLYKSEQSVIVEFIWIDKDQKLYKNYHLKINDTI
ncbi:MHO_1590 family protein [Mesomycoplasma lagogenitalium]